MKQRLDVEFMVRKGVTHALSGLLERLAERKPPMKCLL